MKMDVRPEPPPQPSNTPTQVAAGWPIAWCLGASAINPYTAQALLAPDGSISSTVIRAMIWTALGLAIGLLVLGLRIGAFRWWMTRAVTLLMCSFGLGAQALAVVDALHSRGARQRYAGVVEAEGALTSTLPLRRQLKTAIRDLRVPGPQLPLQESVSVALLTSATGQPQLASVSAEHAREQAWLSAITEAFDRVDVAELHVDSVRLSDETLTLKLEFVCTGAGKGGELLAATATVETTLVLDGDDWSIASWRELKPVLVRSGKPMFVSSLKDACPPELTARLQRSTREQEHSKLLAQWRKTEAPLGKAWLAGNSRTLSHPGLSVHDVNRDGWDDAFVGGFLDPPRLLLGGPQGFRDSTQLLEGVPRRDSACAVFVDFDNDGDADLMLGRLVERLMLFENRGGRWIPRENWLSGGLSPRVASSLSIADYDGDGLLDVYVSTYGNPSLPTACPEIYDWCAPDEVLQRADFRHTLSRRGPPNRLLRNVGGLAFEVVADAPSVRAMTYNAAWSDFDDDGDPDLYCANDFGPDTLLVNEAGRLVLGSPRREEGFGMGASWGDYDADGDFDLYVSNMHSHAGERILTALGSLAGERVRESNQGNWLLANTTSGLRRVSGDAQHEVPVHRASWSWGSQWVDVDSDGDLDLYAPNGNLTPPPGLVPGPDG